MTESIRAYYEEHKTVFEDNFRLVLESFNMEAIHKMRTSTKRLRALFIFLEFLSGKEFNARKQLKTIRTLFRYAGHIREIQIEELVVQNLQPELNEDYPEYLEYLKGREHREIARFLKHLPALDKRTSILNDEEVIRTIENLDPDTLPKKAGEFIAFKQQRIVSIISLPPSNKRIHTNRVHLKQLYYLYGILTGLTSENLLLGLNEERVREIEQFFGDWHDLVNSPVYMNAFFKTKNFRGAEKYHLLKKKIARQRKAMRKEIIDTIYPGLMA